METSSQRKPRKKKAQESPAEYHVANAEVAPRDTTGQQRGAAIRWAGGKISYLPEHQRISLLNDVLDKALHGRKLKEIAADLDVSAPAIHYQLVRNTPDEWRDVQAARALAELEDAEEEMRAAEDMLNLARARETLKHRQWLLERLIPRLYGQKQEVTHTHKVDLESAIQAAQARLQSIAAPQIEDATVIPGQSTQVTEK